jgi:Concanavalin A-like lectin/glucanases superfamily
VLALTRARAARAVALLAFSTVLACSSETRVDLLEPVRTGLDAAIADANTADSRDAEAADAAPTAAHLIHRYSFDGDRGSTHVTDSVEAANGFLKGGATLDGSGHATLDGLDDYVDLPNGLVSSLTDATLVTWLVWTNSNYCWPRVFDFGSSDMGEDMVGKATTTLFATPLHCGVGGMGPTAYYENATDGLGAVDSDVPFPPLQIVSIAVVVDETGGEMRLYVAGTQVLPTVNGEEKLAAPLSMLSDVNDWLGRSQFVGDPYLQGTYDEFRIYNSALSSAQIEAVERAGPNVIAP